MRGPALIDSVTTREHGRIGHITINRPQALNALTIEMIEAIAETLVAWRDKPSIHAVVIEGAGGRAFCAGGDIRAVRSAALAGAFDVIEAFFQAEYALNLAIARYPKPYIALIDGICMGGGVGLSIHGVARVATEAAMFAMPETGIGFFPDVGATYALPRLRGAVGMYMGLTGARLTGADAVYAGVATHFVPRERLTGLVDALAADGIAALAAAAEPAPATLPGLMDQIRCFEADSVPAILARLEQVGTAWSRATLATLRSVSPSAVLWSFEAIRGGAGLTLEAALQAELALTRRVTRHPDLAEGVRAMVVDKDRSPQWQPASLEQGMEAGSGQALLPQHP